MRFLSDVFPSYHTVFPTTSPPVSCDCKWHYIYIYLYSYFKFCVFCSRQKSGVKVSCFLHDDLLYCTLSLSLSFSVSVFPSPSVCLCGGERKGWDGKKLYSLRKVQFKWTTLLVSCSCCRFFNHRSAWTAVHWYTVELSPCLPSHSNHRYNETLWRQSCPSAQNPWTQCSPTKAKLSCTESMDTMQFYKGKAVLHRIHGHNADAILQRQSCPSAQNP